MKFLSAAALAIIMSVVTMGNASAEMCKRVDGELRSITFKFNVTVEGTHKVLARMTLSNPDDDKSWANISLDGRVCGGDGGNIDGVMTVACGHPVRPGEHTVTVRKMIFDSAVQALELCLRGDDGAVTISDPERSGL